MLVFLLHLYFKNYLPLPPPPSPCHHHSWDVTPGKGMPLDQAAHSRGRPDRVELGTLP